MNSFYCNKLKQLNSNSIKINLLDNINLNDRIGNFSISNLRKNKGNEKEKTISFENILKDSLKLNTFINEFPIDSFILKYFIYIFQVIKNAKGFISTNIPNQNFYMKYTVEEALKLIIKKHELNFINQKLFDCLDLICKHQTINSKKLNIIDLDDLLNFIYHFCIYIRILYEKELNISFSAIDVFF